MNDKFIKRHKKMHRNSYFVSDIIFRILWWIMLSLIVASLIQPTLALFLGINRGSISIFAALLIFIIGIMYDRNSDKDVYSYKRENDFLFLGLHDLSNEELSDSSQDIISRKNEADFLTNLLENLIFPQGTIKQAICITGKSGCGKSTILAFFEQMHKHDDYLIYNFSGNYNDLRSTLEVCFDTMDVADKVRKLTAAKKKIVFILDQFERYFFLPTEKKLAVRDLIVSLGQRNTGIIISLREEYLAYFLREFDLNDIKTNVRQNSDVTHHGLIRELVGYVKESENYIVLHNEQQITYSRFGDEHIKDPSALHILAPDTDGVAEYNRTGLTLFYCENQNMIYDKKGNTSMQLFEKCENCFPENATELFNHYCDKPLIEQQIIFHMAESDMKLHGENSAALFCKADEQEVLRKYFDHQLTSTNDYFNASRIMYVLSQARLNQISVKTAELELGLFADHFSAKGKKQLHDTINKLENLQLIRRSLKNSSAEYEIAHDYIASAFTVYSHSNMERDVKDALDIFLSYYMDSSHKIAQENNYPTQFGNRFYHRLKENTADQNHVKYYKIIAVIFSSLIILTDLIFRFIRNPWMEHGANDPTNGFFAFFIPVHLILCLIYFYQLFDKIFRFYSGKKSGLIKVTYFIISFISLVSELFYPHFIASDGIDLVLIGASTAFLPDENFRESSRKALKSYGLRCMLMGGTFALAHFMFCIFNQTLGKEVLVLEFWAMALLVGYAHMAHMTKEYLYSRRMDVSNGRLEP